MNLEVGEWYDIHPNSHCREEIRDKLNGVYQIAYISPLGIYFTVGGDPLVRTIHGYDFFFAAIQVVPLPQKGSKTIPFSLLDNAILVAILRNCGLDDPTILGLVWGEELLISNCSKEIRNLVGDIVIEEVEIASTTDPEEKRIRQIKKDLLELLYRKQVEDFVKKCSCESRNAIK